MEPVGCLGRFGETIVLRGLHCMHGAAWVADDVTEGVFRRSLYFIEWGARRLDLELDAIRARS